ncbi:MAG: spermidine dehydrogenase [Halioglobus sp.]|jgi:spermidine dehydrogenase
MGGVGADVYSAYSARLLEMPGTNARFEISPDKAPYAYSLPGGNTGIFRHIVKYLMPDSIEDGRGIEEVLFNPINFKGLDRPENPIKIRLNTTVIDVSHAGAVAKSDHVNVSYHQDGEVKRVKAKTVVMAIGGWVARRIVSDMPAALAEGSRAAMAAMKLI